MTSVCHGDTLELADAMYTSHSAGINPPSHWPVMCRILGRCQSTTRLGAVKRGNALAGDGGWREEQYIMIEAREEKGERGGAKVWPFSLPIFWGFHDPCRLRSDGARFSDDCSGFWRAWRVLINSFASGYRVVPSPSSTSCSGHMRSQ